MADYQNYDAITGLIINIAMETFVLARFKMDLNSYTVTILLERFG